MVAPAATQVRPNSTQPATAWFRGRNRSKMLMAAPSVSELADECGEVTGHTAELGGGFLHLLGAVGRALGRLGHAGDVGADLATAGNGDAEVAADVVGGRGLFLDGRGDRRLPVGDAHHD